MLALLALIGVCFLLPAMDASSFHALLQNAQFDYSQRLSPRERDEVPALVVVIDEKSLAALGQWPWPRQTLAGLLEKIGAGEPWAIGLDMIFPEADRLGPESLVQLYPQLKNVASLPDPDARLAAALANTPSVLGLAAVRNSTPDVQELRVTPIISHGGDIRQVIGSFPGALGNLPVLQASARGLAFLNARADPAFLSSEQGVLRRMPLVANVSDRQMASLGLEMLRVALDEPAITAQAKNGRVTRIGVGDYSLPTLDSGDVFLHFGAFQPERYVSAIDVLEGRFAAENFRQRFVFLGFSGTGLQDQVLTPLGEKVPGVEIHLQTLEELLSGDALSRPVWLRHLEILLLALAGLTLIAAMPSLRPTRAVSLGISLPVLGFAASYAMFVLAHLLFDVINLLVLLSPVFFILLGGILRESERQRRRDEVALQASRETAARMTGELEAARRIQMGMLPDLKRLFGHESRFQVAACLEPAREVGGDYFDCFMLDKKRLCLAIGDVSGKGLPASLFMAIAKSLGETLLRQHPGDLSVALARLDSALHKNNHESLFVTTFIAAFDVERGILDYVCAGHDAPLRIQGGGRVEQLPVATISGPPLGTCEGFPYMQGRARLMPGDKLLLATDGVTEATNGEEWFGKSRLEALLRMANPDADAGEVVELTHREVRLFEAGSAPADDLTLLALQWHGPQAPGS